LTTVAERLDRALRGAGIPIDGVIVGDEGNRATWFVRYQISATVQHRASGDALVAAFDPTAQAAVDAETAARATAAAGSKDLLATIALITSKTNAGWAAMTTNQKIAAVRADANTWQTLRAFVETNL
jgi:hypothetical protein